MKIFNELLPFKGEITLIALRCDKSLDECVCRLRIQTQGISQALQFW